MRSSTRSHTSVCPLLVSPIRADAEKEREKKTKKKKLPHTIIPCRYTNEQKCRKKEKKREKKTKRKGKGKEKKKNSYISDDQFSSACPRGLVRIFFCPTHVL